MGFRIKILSLILLTYIGYGCAVTQTGKTTGKEDAYSEDLTAYLPEIEVAKDSAATDSTEFIVLADSTSAAVTEKLDIVLDTAAAYARATVKYIDGFTIQVYGGDNRAKAKDYKMNLIRHFPETKPRTVFEQPNYKVRVGTYYTRLEAQQLFNQVKEYFPRAILIPTRIYLK